MTKVNCDYYCKYSKDSVCTCESIKLGFDGVCENYTEIELTDKFYALKNDIDENTYSWVEYLGFKGIYKGREVFLVGDRITDGRTGAYLGYVGESVFERKSNEEITEKLIQLEEEHGLSPLYTDTPKYEIKYLDAK